MAQDSLNNMQCSLLHAVTEKGWNCGNYIHTFLLFQTTFDLDVVDTITVSMTTSNLVKLSMHMRENRKQRDLEKYDARRDK